MKLKIVGIILITTLLLSSIITNISALKVSNKNDDDIWTIMIYMAADNNLEEYAINDFLEMANVDYGGSNVNVVVQFDRIPDYDYSYGAWTTTKRFLITKGMAPTSDNAIMDIGEANMGHPQTLIDFASWTMSSFPADKYSIILWDHGSGWKKFDGGNPRKYVCADDTNWDSLETSELAYAIGAITNAGTNKLELIGFDACLMGMIEIAYELKDYCLFMTASEETEPATGWNYYNTLATLVGDPASIGGEELGGLFVDYYTGNYGITLSTIDLGKIGYLTGAVSILAENLQSQEFKDEIQYVLNNVETYEDYDFIDLYHFSELIQGSIYNNSIDSMAQTVMDEIDNTITSEKHDVTHHNSHGISIYLPYYYYNEEYEYLLFAQTCEWDEFIYWWFYGGQSSDPPEKPIITGPSKGGRGTDLQYTFFSTDPNNDNIYYYIKWGDSNEVVGIGPKKSGVAAELIHSWYYEGGYVVQAKAIDVHGAQSEWAYLPITIPRDRTMNILEKFKDFYPIIENIKKLPIFSNLLSIG